MSLHYLLDGCNIASQLPMPEKETLQDERLVLLRLIQVCRPHGSENNQLTVVFDGYSQKISQMSFAGLDIKFSGGITADDTIRDIIGRSSKKKTFVVVSDDRSVQYSVRNFGAKVMKVTEFLSRLKKEHRPVETMDPRSGECAKPISANIENKITSEFEDIWLGQKRKKSKGL